MLYNPIWHGASAFWCSIAAMALSTTSAACVLALMLLVCSNTVSAQPPQQPAQNASSEGEVVSLCLPSAVSPSPHALAVTDHAVRPSQAFAGPPAAEVAAALAADNPLNCTASDKLRGCVWLL